LTTNGKVIFRDITTVTVGGGGTRCGWAVELQPAAPSMAVAVKHVQNGSSSNFAADLGLVSRFGIMAVLLQQIAR
jgi:hypothetical protein